MSVYVWSFFLPIFPGKKIIMICMISWLQASSAEIAEPGNVVVLKEL